MCACPGQKSRSATPLTFLHTCVVHISDSSGGTYLLTLWFLLESVTSGQSRPPDTCVCLWRKSKCHSLPRLPGAECGLGWCRATGATRRKLLPLPLPSPTHSRSPTHQHQCQNRTLVVASCSKQFRHFPGWNKDHQHGCHWPRESSVNTALSPP